MILQGFFGGMSKCTKIQFDCRYPVREVPRGKDMMFELFNVHDLYCIDEFFHLGGFTRHNVSLSFELDFIFMDSSGRLLTGDATKPGDRLHGIDLMLIKHYPEEHLTCATLSFVIKIFLWDDKFSRFLDEPHEVIHSSCENHEMAAKGEPHFTKDILTSQEAKDSRHLKIEIQTSISFYRGEPVFQSASIPNYDLGQVLAQDFTALLKSGTMSDVHFLVGEDRAKFSAHKLILSARSPVFKSMFDASHGFKESQGVGSIEITDATPNGFDRFLRFLYGDRDSIFFLPTGKHVKDIESTENDGDENNEAPTESTEKIMQTSANPEVGQIMDLYFMGQKYQVPDLLEAIKTKLPSYLSGENVAEFMYLSQRCEQESFRKEIANFIMGDRHHLEQVRESPYYTYLNNASLRMLLDGF